jgi:hypothetical protein
MPSTTDRPDAVADLERAATRLEDAEDAVAEYGEERLRTLADAVQRFERALASNEDAATGTGDFRAYVQFQETVAELVEELDDDVPERAAFEAAEECVDARRLKERHFERAREALAPARELAERLDERADAARAYERARRAARERREAVAEELRRLERVQELGDAPLDAPVENLRDPVERYDEAVRAAFRTFRADAPAREVLGWVERARWYPLVEYRTPPSELLEYVRERPAGEESVDDLLEYAGYSRSKLDHYVDDAVALKRAVATRETYLERLDAEPLTVGWPPPPAGELRAWAGEAESMARAFADEETLAALRAVRRLPERTEYDRLRTAAVARAELTDEQRRRLQEGAVADDVAALREERAAIETALEEYPEP